MVGMIPRIDREINMSTNVPTVKTVPGYWEPVIINASASTAILSFPTFMIWSTPDISRNIIVPQEKIEQEDDLHQLFAEFALEDLEFAEMGLDEYNEILLAEDIE